MKKKKLLIWLIPVCIFLIALGVRLWDINAQGQTWDEIAYYNGGKEYVDNLLKGDFVPDHWRMNFEHPPVGKWIYGLTNQLAKVSNIKMSKFTPGRVASACMGAITIVIVYFFALELFKSRKIAILSSLILCFLPTFLAHNIVMGLETPSALFYTWALYWFYIGLIKDRKYLLLSAIPTGLAIGTRFNNGHILIFMAIAILIYYFIPFSDLDKKKRFPWIAILIPIIAGLLVWALWPWFWGNIQNHLELNQKFLETQLNSQKDGAATDWFLGANVIPPQYYFVYYFIATTPLLLIILLTIYIVKCFQKITFAKIYLLLWFLIFFVMCFVGFKQDGIRYIYPILVPLAIATSYALILLFKKPLYTYVASAILIIYLIYASFTIHPYYLDYYSELVGGASKVYQEKSYEIGWWGEGLEDAYKYVNQVASPKDKVLSLVFPDNSGEYLDWQLDKYNLNSVSSKKNTELSEFKYIITNPAFYWYRPLSNYINIDDYEVIHEIKIQSASLVTIYKHK